jgi:UDP-glucose 4-epimerase
MDVCISNKVNNVVFSSSASVYGVPENSPIREDHPKFPISPYGLTKLFAENLLIDFSNAYGINVSCIRYFNAAGSSYKDNIGESHSPEEHLIPRLIQRAIANEQIELFGNDYNTRDGYAIRDFVHVEDLAELHILALNYNRAEKKNLIINAGSGVGYSVREILDKISELIPIKSYVDSPRRKGDPDILVSDIAMAEKILGWKPAKSIDDIIMSALEWERTRKY